VDGGGTFAPKKLLEEIGATAGQDPSSILGGSTRGVEEKYLVAFIGLRNGSITHHRYRQEGVLSQE
jgi:hypothetical protein